MTAPLHMTSPDGADTGDVLASIRRLISSGDTPSAVCATSLDAGTGGGVQGGAVPLRLRPDALVAASDAGMPSETAAHTPADTTPDTPPGTQADAGADAALQQAAMAHVSPPVRPETRLPESQIHDEGNDMHVSPHATVPPFHLDAAPQPALTETPQQLHVVEPASAEPEAPAAAAPAFAAASASASADNPLRALLRGAVRDELEREMRYRLDTDLRQLVRDELSAALTEALARPTAA